MDKPRILVVDDEEDIVAIITKRLVDAGYAVVTALNGLDALVKIRETRPDLILLDIMMPEMDGFQFKERLSQESQLGDIPVIFLTARSTTADKIAGLRVGVDDYITKPFEKDELLARIETALRKRQLYENISMTDALTGLYNRRFFDRQIEIVFHTARRYKKVFSLAVIDVDQFKKINDTRGHAAGDFVLRAIASVLQKTLRDADIITRYGGDEFVVILPESDEKATLKALERVGDEITGRVFNYNDAGDSLSFTISTGCVEYIESIADPGSMFTLADAAMYRNKNKKSGLTLSHDS